MIYIKHLSTFLVSHWTVSFSSEEILQLEKCSASHYDYECKALSQPGGMIYELLIILLDPNQDSVEVTLEFRDIDLLCKVLEQDDDSKLWDSLQSLLTGQHSHDTQ